MVLVVPIPLERNEADALFYNSEAYNAASGTGDKALGYYAYLNLDGQSLALALEPVFCRIIEMGFGETKAVAMGLARQVLAVGKEKTNSPGQHPGLLKAIYTWHLEELEVSDASSTTRWSPIRRICGIDGNRAARETYRAAACVALTEAGNR